MNSNTFSSIWRPILRWPRRMNVLDSRARIPNRAFSNTYRRQELQQESVSPISEQPPKQPSLEQTTTPTPLLSYHVSRTATNNLPVYTEFKGHRTLHLTMVRKIAGDSQALRQELMELLSLDKKTCFVKSPAMHVYMKGNHRKAVNEFLLSKGF